MNSREFGPKDLLLATFVYSIIGAFIGAVAAMLIEWNAFLGAAVALAFVVIAILLANWLYDKPKNWPIIYIASVVLVVGTGSMVYFLTKTPLVSK